MSENAIRVLHINNTDLAGARFNGFALNKLLPTIGIDSRLLVFYRNSRDSKTDVFYTRNRYFILNRIVQKIEQILSIQAVFYFASWKLLYDRRFKWASVIHLHLIHNGFFSLLTLPFLSRLRPIVWTIHDTWAFTGRCIQPIECQLWKEKCGACPDLTTYFPTYRDHSRFMWWLKKIVYRFTKMELIVASKKMQEMVAASSLLNQFPVHLVPFGIDQSVFKPSDKEAARKRLGVNPGTMVISFRAHAGAYKGLDYLLESIRLLKTDQPLCLISFDERGRFDEFRGKHQLIDVGWTNNEKVLTDVYNASDVFLMPSMAEAFGMMAIEAMACGVPIIVFESTALPWVVDAPDAGIAVPARDSAGLARELDDLLGSSDKRKKRASAVLALVTKRYSEGLYLRALERVYAGAIERFKR